MGEVIGGLLSAFGLLASFDPEVYGIIFLSLGVSGIAVLFASLLGIPAGAYVGLRDFPGKKIVVSLTNTLMGIPPVVVGLFVYLLLSASGPLASLRILYTPAAMAISQFVMCLPIVAGITMAAVKSVDNRIGLTAISLGANGYQSTLAVVREARIGIVTAVIAAFGAAISEVGAIIMVGGNIRFYTRTLTTAIVSETRMGAFGFALALGIVLLLIAFLINIFLSRLQEKK